MDPGASSSHTTKTWLCICQKYCNGQPRIISESSFYRHLWEVNHDSDEFRKIIAFKTLSVDAARTLLAKSVGIEAEGRLPQQAGPSNVPLYARHMEAQRALVKRAQEMPDPRAETRKCADRIVIPKAEPDREPPRLNWNVPPSGQVFLGQNPFATPLPRLALPIRPRISSPTPSSSDTSPPLSTKPRAYEQMIPMSSGLSNFPAPGPVNLLPPFMGQIGMPAPYGQVLGYGQPSFMDYMREMQGVRERIRQLEIEIARVSTERDTLRDFLNRKGGQFIGSQLRPGATTMPAGLSSGASLSSFPPPAVSLAPLETSSKSEFCPTRESHPQIRFWTQKDYNNFLESPQGQRIHLERGQLGYLEELDGTIASREKVVILRSCIRSVWLELARDNRAPRTWKRIDASSYKYFRSFVEEAHPLFKCAVDSWKLNVLACSCYPAWRAHYLDENGKLLSKAERKRRREAKNMVEPDDNDSPLARKKQRLLLVSEGKPNAVAVPTNEESCAPTSIASYPAVSASTSSGASVSNPSKPESENHMLLPCIPSESLSETVIKDSLTSGIGTDDTVMHTNPVSGLAQVPSSLGISVPNDTADRPPPAPDHNILVSENAKSDTIQPLASGSHSTSGPSNTEKRPLKMRPGPGKNGRNLCAHRWLRAFKNSTKGTLAEFNEYFKSLSWEQQEAYRKEATELVGNNAWNKDAFDGKIH